MGMDLEVIVASKGEVVCLEAMCQPFANKGKSAEKKLCS
ncbi:hypothetical protein LINPERHAP2_LOCUS12991 [Linum perenne]